MSKTLHFLSRVAFLFAIGTIAAGCQTTSNLDPNKHFVTRASSETNEALAQEIAAAMSAIDNLKRETNGDLFRDLTRSDIDDIVDAILPRSAKTPPYRDTVKRLARPVFVGGPLALFTNKPYKDWSAGNKSLTGDLVDYATTLSKTDPEPLWVADLKANMLAYARKQFSTVIEHSPNLAGFGSSEEFFAHYEATSPNCFTFPGRDAVTGQIIYHTFLDNALSDEAVLRCLAKEFRRVLGFWGDLDDPDALLSTESDVILWTPKDYIYLAVLYSDVVKNGMNRQRLRAALLTLIEAEA